MMNYQEKVFNSKSENELFDIWKTKEPVTKYYKEKKQDVECIIDHSKAFISDGIVNNRIWGFEGRKKILFVLKEAYGGEIDWSLVDRLKTDKPWSSIWKRVTEWTYGLQFTTKEKVARYTPEKISVEENNPYLNQVAVVNLKKSGGKSSSSYGEIETYAMADKLEPQKQISIINPDIVVCGATFGALNMIYDNQIRPDGTHCDNWFYYSNVINEKETLFIDYYHLANYYPALMNYYGVVNIYHQALQER